MATSKTGLDFYPFSDQGKREQQEDYFYTDPPARDSRPWLGVLADGMGGHEGGNVASKEGVHAIKRAFDAAPKNAKTMPRALKDATAKGHESVLRAAERAGAVGNMGSTVVAFVIDGDMLYWCSAGDSRLYLQRDGKLQQLTHDFTVGEDMRRGKADGQWNTQEIENAPQRNALTSFMGTDDWRADSGSRQLQEGDIVIACSDGVYGTIETDGIGAACSVAGGRASAQQIAEGMHRRVKDAGKSNQDNATAIVVRYAPSGGWIGSWLGWFLTAPGMVSLGSLTVVALAFLAWQLTHFSPASIVATAVSAPTQTPMASAPASAPVASPANDASIGKETSSQIIVNLDELEKQIGKSPEDVLAMATHLIKRHDERDGPAETKLKEVRDKAIIAICRGRLDAAAKIDSPAKFKASEVELQRSLDLSKTQLLLVAADSSQVDTANDCVKQLTSLIAKKKADSGTRATSRINNPSLQITQSTQGPKKAVEGDHAKEADKVDTQGQGVEQKSDEGKAPDQSTHQTLPPAPTDNRQSLTQ